MKRLRFCLSSPSKLVMSVRFRSRLISHSSGVSGLHLALERIKVEMAFLMYSGRASQFATISSNSAEIFELCTVFCTLSRFGEIDAYSLTSLFVEGCVDFCGFNSNPARPIFSILNANSGECRWCLSPEIIRGYVAICFFIMHPFAPLFRQIQANFLPPQ